MKKTKQVFFSDLHMSSAKLVGKGAWYDPAKHQARLLNGLTKHVLERTDEVKELVLLGDFLDNWNCPCHRTPPSYDAIIESNPKVFALLDRIAAAGTKVIYVPGNHDFDFEASALARFGSKITVLEAYPDDGVVHAEHGHVFDAFNHVDPDTDPYHHRPIGYFITRFLASIHAADYSPEHNLSIFWRLVQFPDLNQDLLGAILDELVEAADLGPGSLVQMPAGEDGLTVHEIKDRYAGVKPLDQLWKLTRELYEKLCLDSMADRLCAERGYRAVILGHSHDATVNKDRFGVANRIYANCGSWCKHRAHFVEVDQKPDDLQVSIVWVNNRGETIHKKTERVTK